MMAVGMSLRIDGFGSKMTRLDLLRARGELF